jgi:hypothetical protein
MASLLRRSTFVSLSDKIMTQHYQISVVMSGVKGSSQDGWLAIGKSDLEASSQKEALNLPAPGHLRASMNANA